MSVKQILKMIYNLYKKYEEIANYVIVGAMTTVVSLVTKYALLFTVLDAGNGVQLQISVAISWIVAVLFAYVTNRKFVFKSKDSNIAKEMTKFFSARLATLLMESFILWFFITFLKMNSDFQVVIWTLVSQVIILIGNYILSKVFVFSEKEKSMKNRFINAENIFSGIMFIVLTIICYMFPYTHDDWAWGTSIGLDRLNSLFYNYNGRWLGNLLVILLTRSRVLRALVISTILSLIVYMIKKNVSFKNNCSKYILISLLLLMPVNIIAQSVAWTAGFTNYVIPVLIVLIFMYLNRNIFSNDEIKISNKLIIPLLLLGFSCSLFMEHMTIYNVLLSICVVLYFLIAKKKMIWANLAYSIGSIAGTILMFSNGAYHAVVNSQDTYRSIEQGNIFARALNVYFNSFYKLFIQNNTVLNLFIGIVCICLIYKYLQKNKDTLSKIIKALIYSVSFIIVLYISYSLFIKVMGNSYIFSNKVLDRYLEGIMVILYYIATFITIFVCIDDKKRKYRLLFELISVVIISAPLLIVTPIGPRCFFPTYVWFAFFAIDCFDYIAVNCKIQTLIIFKTCSIILLTFFLIIYGQVYRIDCKRISYIQVHQNDEKLILPNLPYDNYMQVPNPKTNVFYMRFKLFYGINENSTLKFVSYKEWQELKK